VKDTAPALHEQRSTAFTFPQLHERHNAFTLLELLVVIGLIALLLVLIVPAFTTVERGRDMSNTAYTIKGTLEQARNYAMANNTYVWVGFYEEDTTSATPTKVAPPYTGMGRLVIATFCSTDGTASGPIKQIGKFTRIEGVHVADIGAPPSPAPSPTDSLLGRPPQPYTDGSPSSDHLNRISSESSDADANASSFTAQSYEFYKTVRFSPLGEANIDSTNPFAHAAEIGLRPSHGRAVDNSTPKAVAIQFGATDGNVRIYLR
jgi:prepilin-type N-terminal cleavage/methylation domain-containing protein